MMREEFIIKHPKIDIILFDIFSDFAMEAPDVWHSNGAVQKSILELSRNGDAAPSPGNSASRNPV